MNRNYEKEMERLIESFGPRKPRLLLHGCCAPCSSSVLERLTEHFRIDILWYNPNIYPEAEFTKRRETLKKLLRDMGLEGRVGLICLPWQHERYDAATRGLDGLPEGGERCRRCFGLRLEEAARYAAQEGYDYFCSTLSLSRHKDARLINALGEELGERYGAVWLPSDLKKRDGENRSIELCQKYGVYRQVYCGCRSSYERRLAGGPDTKEDNNESQEGHNPCGGSGDPSFAQH